MTASDFVDGEDMYYSKGYGTAQLAAAYRMAFIATRNESKDPTADAAKDLQAFEVELDRFCNALIDGELWKVPYVLYGLKLELSPGAYAHVTGILGGRLLRLQQERASNNGPAEKEDNGTDTEEGAS